MNTYNENLQVTVNNALSGLAAEQQKRASEQISAEYNLYYAQGAEITAEDKLKQVIKEYDFAEKVDGQGIDNDNQAVNLLATSTQAEKNVALTVTNSAAAASNVQIAANAVAKLAADIGSAFNIVTAADYGTDIYKMTKHTNELIRKTANHAEHTSQLAMEASTSASEIIAKEVLSDVTKTKSEVENVLTVTGEQFSKLIADRTAKTVKLSDASQAERKAEGILLDGDREYAASTNALDRSNKELNYGLKVDVKSSETISVTHKKLKQAFSALVNDPSSNAVSGNFIPQAVKNYYVTLVKSDKKSLFNLELAESVFTDYKEERFIPENKMGNINVGNYKDVDGGKILAGSSYVVFLYVELTLAYKKFVNNFSDVISSPSQDFLMATQLPSINAVTYKTDAKSVDFTVKKPVEGVEYRCIFLPEKSGGNEHFLTDINSAESEPGFYFNLSIAEQVSAANYSIAKKHKTAISDTYQVTVGDDTTDNFGDEIVEGNTYLAVILSIIPPSSANSKDYLSSLSDLGKVPKVILKANKADDSDDATPAVPAGRKTRARSKSSDAKNNNSDN